MTEEPAILAENISESTELKILVDSSTARYSSTISAAAMSLIVGTGNVEGGPQVMVPFVECEISGNFGTDDVKRTESVLITVENAAFLIESFTNEFARLMPAMTSLSAGPLKPVGERLHYARDCLQRASANLLVLVDALAEFPAVPVADQGGGDD